MPNQLRILIVGNFLSSQSGTRGVCEDLALQLTGRGCSVTTASAQRTRMFRLIDMLWTAWTHKNQYDVAQLDVFSGPSFVWAEAIAWTLNRLQKPYILTLHGGKLPEFAQRWPKRVKRLLDSAKIVTTPSYFLKQAFAQIRGDIFFLPNAIDLSAYQFRHRPNPEPRLVWLRAFYSTYNPMLAAKTIALLAPDFPGIELTMFGPNKGDGSLEKMESWAKHAGIFNQIRTVGRILKTEVPLALSPHDIFLNTTTVESFGVSVMEAAALGMCVVTTNVGELPYIWTDGHDALLVPPDDPQAMADAIRRILTEPELAGRLSRNARARAEQFDWPIVLPQWEALLDATLIERHG